MSNVPNLLNDDGTASIATMLMLAHHGFRRDLAQFSKTLESLTSCDAPRLEALREEWQSFHMTLHGHHEAEDGGVFPAIANEHASALATLEKLSAEHRRIDPLLERGDAAFERLPETDEALAVVRELKALLEPHLATEEREIIPFLREAKSFPPPPSDDAAAVYAEGFAWSMHGIAPEVLERVYAMLPENLLARIPAARSAFEARCKRVWGSANTATTRTPIPAS